MEATHPVLKHASFCSFRRIRKTNSPTLGENMKNLKRLGVALALTLVLGVSTFAGEMNSPPCVPPDPGETHTPPCAAAQPSPDGSAAPGDILTPPSDTVDILSVVDAAMN